MRIFSVVCLYLVIGLGSAKANWIDYQFDTLTFSDNHQVTGMFTYDHADDKLIALSISLFGDNLNINFDINDLVATDAFSISFDNMVFGDSAFEGFQLFKDNIELVTGEFGLGMQDTCYYDPETCTGSLFTFQNAANAVDTPQPIYLFALGLLLLFSRRVFT